MCSTAIDPVQCEGDNCRAYLISGGAVMFTPRQNTSHPSYPLVLARNVLSMHVEFLRQPRLHGFVDTEGVHVGVRLCLRQSQSKTRLLDVGLFVCQNGTVNDACSNTSALPNITTTVSFYTRQATVIASRSNFSIASISDLTDPVLVPDIDLSEYRKALNWLLNYTAANIPAMSSILESFWFYGPEIQSPENHVLVSQKFESVITWFSPYF
ncbi:hypothetical protein QBC46DRAFT_405902 [Diplogelasinospora grovesii]|uniref:Uncharacterized protein n=1 Tax=Diplogelasinospora grovesii TaxID=303347 RepID=A0AAN6ND37_9PEZI|nr:hypothetical protein QBC46DRAFT_405902 [Diplogelasinospora grovesii]